MNSDYLVGTVLENRYEILEMIGSGGMATVYKAKCRVLNRYVAIKVLKDSLKYDVDVVKKFNAESRAAAALSHPNIVQVYDVNETVELDYIVMEYIDGVTLKDYIAKKGTLDWKEACNFAIQIGKALDVAHKNRIIHKDIKPHNVLITRDGILKVADFGIAQATTTETIVAGDTGIGSVHYISPEQGRGGYIDERSDIYSLGVVLYEMLTGKLPFDGTNAVAIAIAKLEKDPLDCKIVNPNVPDSVARVTMKAISKEQHSRYQSANEMVMDLQSIVGNNPVIIEKSREDSIFETNRISKDKTKEMYYMRKNNSRGKKSNSTLKMAIVLIALAIVVGFGTYFLMSGGEQEYQVPSLTGYTIEQAEKILEETNLRLSEDIEYEESDEVEEGQIISQTPGANSFVKKNRKIKIVVSLGLSEEEAIVPDVQDIPIEEAKSKLEKEGLSYKIEEKFDENIEIGNVISQSPKKDTKVSKGYKVILYVCANQEEEQAVVPKLTGVTEEEAKKLILEAGLTVGSIDKEANSAEKGLVFSQTPAAKTGVVKGSAVSFTVSEGQQAAELKRKTLTITIPDDANETVHVKVVANGKTIHDKDHKKTEGTVDIEVQASKDASVQAYIDGNMVVDKIISFD